MKPADFAWLVAQGDLGAVRAALDACADPLDENEMAPLYRARAKMDGRSVTAAGSYVG
ncbi:MAG TPA: hypothetical protein VM925_29020 [Labilithrix sp.]|jgi:hypothetical protein|nr:hypothetical protein [Labilithrix sp.]